MTISGVALLAICALLGQALGEILGLMLGVKANVGGVGIAMMLLITARITLTKRGLWTTGVNQGVMLWASLYIPIVVAMAAQQDVAAALSGGPMVIITGIGTVILCFASVAIITRLAGNGETMDDIEARENSENTNASGAA